ncbi:MAG: hypothetical protein ACOX4I_02845 [Anaerovoracaceae bacterium]|jgi:hypothetical protein
MRFEVIVAGGSDFENAIYTPVTGAVEFGSKYKELLAKAAAEKCEQLDIREIDAQEKTSGDFQFIGIAERVIQGFLKTNKYPKTVRILCTSEKRAALYKSVYNFWFAAEKIDRMQDDRWD